jgi:dipeptidyl aminopeptidase/acylaminoacyl peptidase
MRTSHAVVLSLLAPAIAAAQVSGPADRQVTDPKGIGSPANAAAHPIPVADLFYTRSVNGGAWSPDGKQVVLTTNLTGRSNLWKLSVSGSWPVQLVQSDERQFSATWSPDGKWIAYQQDSGGNELWDIWAVPADGGAAINLTNTPDRREESPLWSPDGAALAIAIKPKDGTSYDLAILDWATRKVRQLTHEASPDRQWQVVAWSPDGKTLYAERAEVGFTDSDVYAVDVASGQTTNLTPHEGRHTYEAGSLSPDGKTLLVTSNAKNGGRNVALLDIASHQITWATDTLWEASAGSFAPDGKSFTYLLNADGLVDVYLVDRQTLKARKLDLGGGVNSLPELPSAFSPGGDRLLVSHESSVQPRDLYVYDLRAAHGERLTRSAIASLSSAAMPPAQVVHYKSFDGKLISALMWVPYNLKRDGSNPAIVLPHGGPTGQWRDTWDPDRAALVSNGYICIAPNVRGSTGYGIEFQRANYQDLGGGDLQDEVYATRFLEATGYVSPKKLGITGGSYGGYMTLMAIGKTPDIWAAAVELFGIINWKTMLQHSDPLLQQYEQSLLGDPVKDLAVYERDSPLAFIHDVKAPLLVLQGDNDPRVPKEEAVQVVELLKKDGKTVEAHYYPDEGHGFAKRENRIDAIHRTLEWFDKYLKGKPQD